MHVYSRWKGIGKINGGLGMVIALEIFKKSCVFEVYFMHFLPPTKKKKNQPQEKISGSAHVERYPYE